ncbi:MAG: IclR family transcriptional regulator [Variovorax sp.]|nr:MAG: IclR family transcriptional regulator [Variovorax sp.]
MKSTATEPDDTDAERRPKYAVPAVEKALDVLELLSAQAVPMTQAQLARALGREPSEIFRMLSALEGRGYLRREDNGGYVLTLKLFELSRTHSPHEQLLRAATAPMRELGDSIRESCHLSVLHRDQLLVLTQVDAPTSIRLSVEAGSLHSAVDTLSGQVLLANSPDAERDEVLARRAEFQRKSADERAVFLAMLAKMKADGWGYAENARFVGGRDLSVPVGHPLGRTRAVLTIASLRGTHTAHDDLFDLLPRLQKCADDIGRIAGIA